jgi:quercetin dioxygenase-like cupin family protein
VQRPTPPEHRDDQADFLAEAGPNDQALLQDGLLALSSLLPPTDGQLRGAERLARAVSELPLRYAPFYRRLGSLWQISEEQLLRELARARSPQAWTPTWLRGVKTFEIRSSTEARSRLLCFGAGVRFPKHRHRAPERVLVLEGSYVDSTGRTVRAGDEQLMAAGSEHQLQVSSDRDCIAAVCEGGIEFTGPLLRWATKLFG